VIALVDYYSYEDLFHIVQRSAGILEIEIDDDGTWEIARRSRGTPRIANRILRRTRDYAEVKASGKIDRDIAKKSLTTLRIDERLDEMDRRILATLIDKFDGGPVGISSLAVAIGEDSTTIEDVYEPFLIKEGFMQRTSRGRIAQEKAFKLLGKNQKQLQRGFFND
jgi:Holliday junction DNA helicase RuvB